MRISFTLKRMITNRPKERMLPDGLIFTDDKLKNWRLGKSIGQGCFGEIFLASNIENKPTEINTEYVAKVQLLESMIPIYEKNKYIDAGNIDRIENWKKEKKLKFLGMPKLISTGRIRHEDKTFLFMILERLGDDLERKLRENNLIFPEKTVYTIGKMVLDVIEYNHSYGWYHGDIKAANLLLGYGPGKENEIYLSDFGLTSEITECDAIRNFFVTFECVGTMIIASRDAHTAVCSKRGDLETLGYNLILWLGGHLPWLENKKNISTVEECVEDMHWQKSLYMNNIPWFMKQCFTEKTPPCAVTEYFLYVASLDFKENPNHQKCKNIFSAGIKALGLQDDGLLDFTSD